MIVIRYPFVRVTSVLAPSLLFLLSATGVHAEISTQEFAIVSAPPITTYNEAVYHVFGDCTYIDGNDGSVTVTYSNPEHVDVVVETLCTVNDDWSVTADITKFGTGHVDEDGILKHDVKILAVYTDDYGVNREHPVWVYRNTDASRPASDLTISLTENRTVVGKSFDASATCGATKITMNHEGLITVSETDCARMVSTINADMTLAMTDSLTGASGACEFKTLTMNAAGDIHITVDPEAAERCLDDKDRDGILDLQDPEPGTGLNNNLCVDSQNLIDNIAMTGDADTQPDILICDANESITVQGIKLNSDSDVCYMAGQFVQFVSQATKDETRAGEPIFSVPSGTSFAIATGGSDCSNIGT